MSGLGHHKNNARVSVQNWGFKDIMITGLGYGKTVASSESEARREKAFYSKRATSGLWFVETIFTSYEEFTAFQFWLLTYYNRITDPKMAPLSPMKVSVPSRKFEKLGYPVAELQFGDYVNRVTYTMTLNFVSASDPDVTAASASKYAPPLREAAVASARTPSVIDTFPTESVSPYVPAAIPIVKRY